VRVKIAIPVKDNEGLESVISDVFSRAKYFFIGELEKERLVESSIIENEYTSLEYGAGPLVIKMLKDKGVKVVATREIGMGASSLLKSYGIKRIQASEGTTVKELIKLIQREL